MILAERVLFRILVHNIWLMKTFGLCLCIIWLPFLNWKRHVPKSHTMVRRRSPIFWHFPPRLAPFARVLHLPNQRRSSRRARHPRLCNAPVRRQPLLHQLPSILNARLVHLFERHLPIIMCLRQKSPRQQEAERAFVSCPNKGA